jgi:hypothetical protein
MVVERYGNERGFLVDWLFIGVDDKNEVGVCYKL